MKSSDTRFDSFGVNCQKYLQLRKRLHINLATMQANINKLKKLREECGKRTD